MSDTFELPPHPSSGSPVGVGGAAPAVSEVHDTSIPLAQRINLHADELVKPQIKAQPVDNEPTLMIDKTQGLVFVSTYYQGSYTEFVLEDAVAIAQENSIATIFLREGHCLSFGCTKVNADLLLDAWRSRRGARRNA